MNDMIERGEGLISKIRQNLNSVANAQAEKKFLADGVLAIYFVKGGVRYFTTLSDEDIDDIKQYIATKIDGSVAASKKFLDLVLGAEEQDIPDFIPAPAPAPVTAPVVEVEMPFDVEPIVENSTVTDTVEDNTQKMGFDAEFVIAQLKAGKSVPQIAKEFYPQHVASWLYKRLNAAGIDHKAILAQAAEERLNAEMNDSDWQDIPLEDEQAEQPRRSASC